ncbi:cysteine-tryptophan domain-containing zinc finger protein 3-like isoform X2 [Wolffia australiana]
MSSLVLRPSFKRWVEETSAGIMPIMEEKGYDLEEGVASDRDLSLSFMDDKIRGLLDTFQRKLEDGVSREELAAEKIDQYGSFLPIYLRGPVAFPAKETPTIPQNGQRKNNSLSLVPSSGVKERRNSVCPSASTSGEIQRKEPALKIRIKIGSERLNMGSNKNLFQPKEDMPKDDIDQIMKEFEAMGEPFLSPLHESFLCLEEKEIQHQVVHKEDLSVVHVDVRDINQRPLKSKGVILKKAKVLKPDSKVNIKLNASENCEVKSKIKVVPEEPKEAQGMVQNKNLTLSSGEKREKVGSKRSRQFSEKQIGLTSSESASILTEDIQMGPMNDPLEKAAGVPVNDLAVDGSATVAQMIEENWVCCDTCQKWRLLPYGTNPDSLPKRWICAMLTWLPQMNKCTFSEDETTVALRSLYQLPPKDDAVLNSIQLPKPVMKKRKLVDDLIVDSIDAVSQSVEFSSVKLPTTQGEKCSIVKRCSVEGKPRQDHKLGMVSSDEKVQTSHKVRVKVKRRQSQSRSQTDCAPQNLSGTDTTAGFLGLLSEKQVVASKTNCSDRINSEPATVDGLIKENKVEKVRGIGKKIKKDPHVAKCGQSSSRNRDFSHRLHGSNIREFRESPVESVSSFEAKPDVVEKDAPCNAPDLLSGGNLKADMSLDKYPAEKPSAKLKKKLGQLSSDSEVEEKEASCKVSQAVSITEQLKLEKKPSNEVDVPSFIRNFENPNVIVAFKEARDLKHTADRYKAEGFEREGTGLYFKSALKFLHVASLLELSSTENGNAGDAFPSMSMYSDTAKLCGFCAHEFEKCKEMAAASLAHKCTEVAYMKVVFFKQSTAMKDQHELHTSLLFIPSEESPPSSASDVENLNNQSNLDKTALTKGHNSSRGDSNNAITLQNRPTLFRLLNFAQDINYAMEASRRSYFAFNHAKAHPEECCYGSKDINSVERVLELSFHAVDTIVHLVTDILGNH